MKPPHVRPNLEDIALLPRAQRWTERLLANHRAHLSFLQDDPGGFWRTRAKRLSLTLAQDIRRTDAVLRVVADWHAAFPKRDDVARALETLNTLRNTLEAALPLARQLAKTAVPFKDYVQAPGIASFEAIIPTLDQIAIDNLRHLDWLHRGICRNWTLVVADGELDNLTRLQTDHAEILTLFESYIRRYASAGAQNKAITRSLASRIKNLRMQLNTIRGLIRSARPFAMKTIPFCRQV